MDLKAAFSSKNLNWVSFNNISQKETSFITSENETVLGESGSHTATIGLSPELLVQRIGLEYLPSSSGTPRTILGVEVINALTGGHFAIFSVHSDYLIQDGLYSATTKTIHLFIKEFTGEGRLPFVFGGDLNAFEGLYGSQHIEDLKAEWPLRVDYREGDFYSPKEIVSSTFVGHHRDDYKIN
ncbi:MAG: hypothetical protein H0W50_00295 [Parachlamydiaceae bacterium]|nr:hypothetical protein [Parachlamydiaceae bacterium]